MFWKTLLTMELAILMGLAGCGGPSDVPTVAPVTGTVTHAGKPLESGTIVFHPVKGRSASGQIKDGKIVEMSTLAPNDGAPIGACKVTVQAVTNVNDMYAEHKSLIPEWYGDIARTDLTATVEKGKTNEFKFELKDQ